MKWIKRSKYSFRSSCERFICSQVFVGDEVYYTLCFDRKYIDKFPTSKAAHKKAKELLNEATS